MAEDPKQDDLDLDEDIFGFDQIADEFDSSLDDEEDLEAIFAAFQAEEEEALPEAPVADETSEYLGELEQAPAASAAGAQPVTEQPAAQEFVPPPAQAPAAAQPHAPAAPAAPAAAPVHGHAPQPPYPAAAQIPQGYPQPAAYPPHYPQAAQPGYAAPAAPAAPQAQPQAPFQASDLRNPRKLMRSVLSGATGISKSVLLIVLSVTLLNGLVAIVMLQNTFSVRNSVDEAKREITDARDEILDDKWESALEAQTLRTPIVPPNPETHPTFERAKEQIERGEYAQARQALYALLSVVDRLEETERSAVEARALYLLAEATHLEALKRMGEGE